MGSLRAITLWPEWAWAICHLGKRVENRTWHPPRELIGRRLAIHAGAHVGGRKGSAATAEGRTDLGLMALRAGWVLLRSGVFQHRETAEEVVFRPVTSAVVAVATLTGVDDEDRTPWDVPGDWHWRLDDVVVLDRPVPMRGAQGLWTWTPGLDGRDDVR